MSISLQEIRVGNVLVSRQGHCGVIEKVEQSNGDGQTQVTVTSLEEESIEMQKYPINVIKLLFRNVIPKGAQRPFPFFMKVV